MEHYISLEYQEDQMSQHRHQTEKLIIIILLTVKNTNLHVQIEISVLNIVECVTE